MGTYCIQSKILDDYTVVFGEELSKWWIAMDVEKIMEYGNKVNPIMSFDNHIFLVTDDTHYDTSFQFDFIEYRSIDGTIKRVCSNFTNYSAYYVGPGTQLHLFWQNDKGSYEAGVDDGTTENLPIWWLLCNELDRGKPYLKIKLKESGGKKFVTRNGYTSYMLVDVDYKEPYAKSVTISRDSSNKRYSAVANLSYLATCKADVYKVDIDGNGKDQKTATIEDATDFKIPYSYLQQGENRIEYTITAADGLTTSKHVETIIHRVPTISNLSVTNKENLVDSDTMVSWSGTNQDGAAIYIDDKLYKKFDGTGQATVIPKGTLQVGKNKITVKVLNYFGDDVAEVSAYKEINLDRIESEITENSLTISSTNIDEDIKVSWKSSNQSKYRIYQGDRLIVSKTGSETTCTIPKGSFKYGKYELKLVVVYSGACGDVEAENIITRTFTRNEPVIYSIEPSNLSIDVDVSRIISFSTNEFVDRWELSFAGIKSTGTAGRSVTTSPGVFNVGTNSITLTVFYAPPYNSSDVRKSTKTVTFTGYGTPDRPYIDGNTIYSTASPMFTWSFSGQTAYQVILLKDGVVLEDTGNLFNATNNFTPSQELEDNAEYTIKVRCRGNKKWSEFATKNFTTKFNNIEIPSFYLFASDTSINISITGKQPKDFNVLSIYRKDEITDKWVEIAFNCNVKDSITDHLCPANVLLSYKLRVYDNNGAYRDSEIKSITLSLNSYILTKTYGKMIDFRLIEADVQYDHNKDVVAKVYSGDELPVVYYGKKNYITGNIEVTFKNADAIRFIKYLDDKTTYCLRDIRGKRLFVRIQVESEKPIGIKKVKYSISFTEVNFDESRISEGIGKIKYTYVDGEYKVDGSIDLSGVDHDYYS